MLISRNKYFILLNKYYFLFTHSVTLIYLYLHLFSLIIHDFVYKKREDIAFKLIIPLFNLKL